MKPLWKKGDTVTIFQLSHSKGLFIEGKAKIVKPLDKNGGEHYEVRFENEPDATYQRFVDRQGNEQDPAAYVAEFNKRLNITA